MAEKKTKTVAKTDEERYLEAKKLTDATPCLMRDKEKAEIYDSIAKIYESLGDYKDSMDHVPQFCCNCRFESAPCSRIPCLYPSRFLRSRSGSVAGGTRLLRYNFCRLSYN